jgi:uncharacterized protein YeaO (DUF488 family)
MTESLEKFSVSIDQDENQTKQTERLVEDIQGLKKEFHQFQNEIRNELDKFSDQIVYKLSDILKQKD